MDEREASALHDALAKELRAVQHDGRLTAPRIEELTGIHKDTVRRIFSGKRPVTVVEVAILAANLGFNAEDLINRAKESAFNALGPSRGVSSNLRDKITLIATAAGRTAEALYFEVADEMSGRGFHFPRSFWNELLSGATVTARREVLFALGEVLNVDPTYLTTDDPAVDRMVEAQLRFHRAMGDLGVEQVSARAVRPVGPEDLEEIQEVIAKVLKERR